MAMYFKFDQCKLILIPPLEQEKTIIAQVTESPDTACHIRHNPEKGFLNPEKEISINIIQIRTHNARITNGSQA